MAVTILTDFSAAVDSRTLSWTIPSLAIGDVVVVCASTWDQADTLATPTGTGLTFTLRAQVNVSTRPHTYVWTAVASSGGLSVVVTATAASSSLHTGLLYQCPTADGYSLAGTPNIHNSDAGTGAPSGSISSTAGSLILVTSADWDGAATAPAYIGSATEDGKVQSAGNNSHYYYHQTAAGSSTSIGMTAPATQKWSLAAVEVLKAAEAGATTTRRLPTTPNKGPLKSSYGARVIGFVQGIVATVTQIINEALTESGSASDSLATVVDAVNSATESTTAGESLTNVITALSSVTEAGAASETLAPAQDVPASLTEAAAAADAMTPQGAQFPALTESVTAVDSPAANQDSQPSLIEAASATDSHGTQLVAVEAVTEAGGAIDELFPTGDGGGTGGTENEYDRRVRR